MMAMAFGSDNAVPEGDKLAACRTSGGLPDRVIEITAISDLGR
jgi:hypothetical protein